MPRHNFKEKKVVVPLMLFRSYLDNLKAKYRSINALISINNLIYCKNNFAQMFSFVESKIQIGAKFKSNDRF